LKRRKRDLKIWRICDCHTVSSLMVNGLTENELMTPGQKSVANLLQWTQPVQPSKNDRHRTNLNSSQTLGLVEDF